MKKMRILIGLAMMGILLFSGCSRKGDSSVTYLTVKGSDTMVHLASNWAEEYMGLNSSTDISVTGGGSGTGIAALLNGTTDICIASRIIKPKEVELALEKGIDPRSIITARDGIAVIVHPDNPIGTLTIEQIGKIYTGAYTNWNQLGGPDADIVVLSRESSSGTYVFFQKRVMNKKDYTTEAMLMPSTSSIVQTVSQDVNAIGYVGLGYAVAVGDKVKMLSVKDSEQSPAVAPSIDTVTSGSYAIARPLHFYVNGDPTGGIKSFIDYCLSSEGQHIVLESGYVPIN